VTPLHVHVVTAKGREYAWHQRGRGTGAAGPRTRLPWPPYLIGGEPNPEFWEAYGKFEDAPNDGPRPWTFAALAAAYLVSPEFESKSTASKPDYRRYLKKIVEVWGGLRVDGLTAAHVLAWRDLKRNKAASTNYLLRVLSLVMGWSIPRGYRKDNPCQHVPFLQGGDGWAAWAWEQICHFQQHAVPQMMWAMTLALYTGQRQSDVLKMKWTDINGGVMQVVQNKSGKKRLTVWVPIHKNLKLVLDAMPKSSIYLVTNLDERQWTPDGFRSMWANQMECLGLESGMCDGLQYHGLRKSAVCFMLEAGCTTAEVSSITGQSLQMVEHYARMMNRDKLAASAILKWEIMNAATEADLEP
jgi:Phage integrase family